MNWGNSIILAFVLFIGFVAVIVFKAMNEDLSLTSKDYYEQELDYGNRMKLQQNFLNLDIKPKVEVHEGVVSIQFGQKIDQARLSFYKPNQSSQDFNISTQDSLISVSLASKSKGLWKLRLFYTIQGIPIYQEESTYIN